jgi:ParB-like chromosome segregation protein Spo0J
MKDRPYLILPPLTQAEYDALKANIVCNGIKVPIETDEFGNILDGEHRYKICLELGKKNIPRIVRAGLSEDRKLEHVLTLNLTKRHLSRDDLKAVAQTLRERGWPQERIGFQLGVTQKTVSNWFAESRNITELATIVGKDGKSYPSKKRSRSLKDRAQLEIDPTREKELRAETTLLLDRIAANGSEIENNSLDLLITQLRVEHPKVLETLGTFAARVLKPGKLLVFSTGQKHLLEAIRIVSNRLRYVWAGGIILHNNPVEIGDLRIHSKFELLLFFAAGPYKPTTWFTDLFSETQLRDRSCAIQSLIDELTGPGELIFDPFGDGKIVTVTENLNRPLIDGPPQSLSLLPPVETPPRLVGSSRSHLEKDLPKYIPKFINKFLDGKPRKLLPGNTEETQKS